MQCTKCGYQMLGSEAVCICCGRRNLSAANLPSSNLPFPPLPSAVPPSSSLPFPMPVKQMPCRTCGLLQDETSRYCRSCGLSDPIAVPSGVLGLSFRHWPDGVKAFLAAVLLAALLLGLGLWGAKAEQSQERADAIAAQQAEQARQARIAATLAGLRSSQPAAAFALYPGDNAALTLPLRLKTCDIRGLTFSRADGSSSELSVTVGLTGYQVDSQAPKVFVALYDETGDLLAQKAIVEFALPVLAQGETREVVDTMDYPAAGTPFFASASGGDADASPSPTDSPATDSPAQSAVPPGSGSPIDEGYKAAMDGLCRRFDDQGYVTLWPHEGDPDALGVVVGDAIPGGWSPANKKALTKAMAEEFEKIRSRANRTGPSHTFVRFTPSGTVYEAVTPE